MSDQFDESDDQAAREERARKLHEQIDELGSESPPPPESPHEAVERAMDEDLETGKGGEADPAEESAADDADPDAA